MSTATSFKYHRPFPFCTDDAPEIVASGYDYVELTETGGDEGLTEAMRLWWLLESVVLTPTGAANDGSSDIYFQDPLTGLIKSWGTTAGDLSTGEELNTGGCFTNGLIEVVGSSAVIPNEPRDRVCSLTTGADLTQPTILSAGNPTSWVTSGGSMLGNIEFVLAYVSNRWRLYYTVLFELASDSSGSGLLILSNPARGISGTAATFSYAGYTLDFEYSSNGTIVETPTIDVDYVAYTF